MRAGRRRILFDNSIIGQSRIRKLVALEIALGQIVLGLGGLAVVFVVFQKVIERTLRLIVLAGLVGVDASVNKRQRDVLLGA